MAGKNLTKKASTPVADLCFARFPLDGQAILEEAGHSAELSKQLARVHEGLTCIRVLSDLDRGFQIESHIAAHGEDLSSLSVLTPYDKDKLTRSIELLVAYMQEDVWDAIEGLKDEAKERSASPGTPA